MLSKEMCDRIDKMTSPEPNSGCWLWLGYANEKGYAWITSAGKNLKVHRLNCERFNGPIPEGAVVMHSCHNRICVNPKHLRHGTTSQNNFDMYRSGRRVGKCHRFKDLTQNQIPCDPEHG